MPRSVDDLESNAETFWPSRLSEHEQKISILPKLIETQEKFIGILYVADGSPEAWKEVLNATKGMPGNLFLKHLIVLTDIGGEKLQRFRKNLNTFFPKGKMNYVWKNQQYLYRYKSLKEVRDWSNPKLSVDGQKLLTPQQLMPVHEDVTMLLIHGGASIDPGVPDDILEKCNIGTLLGCKRELDSFVRQRYIYEDVPNVVET